MKILRRPIDMAQFCNYNQTMKKLVCAASLVFFSFLVITPNIFSQTNNEASITGSQADSAVQNEPLAGSDITAVPVSPEGKLVKVIEIKGNKTIGIPTILSKIKTRVGEEYIQNVISDDLKRLYNTGYFDDVSVDHQDFEGGFKVIIYLVEKPIVEKVTFTKTRYFNPRAIAMKLNTKEGKFLDNKTLKDDMDLIKDMYVKNGLTNVAVEAETELNKATNKAKLHFVIREGDRLKIAKIKISGNTSFKYKKILRIMKTRADSLLTSGFLKEEILKEDMERIRVFYESQGFVDAAADYSIEYGEKGRMTVLVSITEGSKYFVGKITIRNNKIFTTAEVLAVMKEIKEGKVFSRAKLDLDMAQIRSMYFDKGYIFANVRESASMNSDTGKVEIALDVEEGDLAYVNKVNIQGNTRTRDIVIRREIRLEPGDKFDGEKLRRSKDRLRDLGYFEDVGYDIEDTEIPNYKNLVVQVKEAKTGTLSFGGGYSTIDQVVGFVEVEQKNFDFANWPTFTGGGQNLVIHAEAGSLRNNQRISFTEPWIFDFPISGGFDIYRTMRLRESDIGYGYDEERVGGDLRFGKQLSEYISAGTVYRLEDIKIGNLEDGATADLMKEVGKNTVSSLTFHLTRDTRDSAFNPTKGLLLGATTEVAGGFLGGDKDFTRFEGRGSYNIPLLFGSVLEFRLKGGVVEAFGDSDYVPIFERYFAGGAYSIRGYNERRVGPIDPVTEDPIGGEALVVGNIEYTIPLVDFIKLAGFFDTGNVWASVDDFGEGDFKSGAGLGLRVRTPIGPINLDYGYPLNDEPGEEARQGKFYFSVSRGF